MNTIFDSTLDGLSKLEEQMKNSDNENKNEALEKIKELELTINKQKERLMAAEIRSTQFNQAIINVYNQVNSLYVENIENDNEKFNNQIDQFTSGINKLSVLEKLAVTKDNIVIIGSNGAGKSSFVSSLKQLSMIQNMIILPAQKALFYFEDAAGRQLYKKSFSDVATYLNKNFIAFSKGNFGQYNLVQEYLDNFSIMITALSNDYINFGMKIVEKAADAVPREDITFNKLKFVWKILFPHIELNVDSNQRSIYPVINGQKFNINSLSDGEKCVLYYVGNILMAPNNSYIIVDEPETFLNPSIYNKVWDLLCNFRNDCQFIFCSHNIDFIISRTKTTLVWSKEFQYPNYWDIEFVPNSTSLPVALLAELLGSRKKILFCEGDDKESIDFKIFSVIFLEDFTVYPAGGHIKAIQYVKAFNQLSSLHNNKAIGIVDGDLMDDTARVEYEKESVFTLPINEIEMLLFTDQVMRSYLYNVIEKDKADEKIIIFKDKFNELVSKNKVEIAISKVKKIIDYKLENYRMQSTKTLDGLDTEYNNLNQLVDVKKEYAKAINELNDILSNGDYSELLRVCNLKKAVSKGLANKYLDSDYEEKAIYRIRSDKKLVKKIRGKYFGSVINNSTFAP